MTGVGRPGLLSGPGGTMPAKVTNMGITTSTTVPLIVVGSNVPGLDTDTTFLIALVVVGKTKSGQNQAKFLTVFENLKES